MSTDSKGKQLSIILTDRVKTITQANGYRTNIGATVFRGRTQLDETKVPLAAIYELDETPASRQTPRSPMFKEVAQIRVEGYAICDKDNPNDIGHDIVADLKHCLFEKEAIPGAFTVEYVSRSLIKREDGLKISGGALTINVTYVEDISVL